MGGPASGRLNSTDAHFPQDEQRVDNQQQEDASPKCDALNATIHSAAVVCANRPHTDKEDDQKRLDRQHGAEQFDRPTSSWKREMTVRLEPTPFCVSNCRARQILLVTCH
jgi:hypothetical protein